MPKSNTYSVCPTWLKSTVDHDFNGINGVNGKTDTTDFHLVNKLHDFTRMDCLSGKFCCNTFFRKTHARPYCSHDRA